LSSGLHVRTTAFLVCARSRVLRPFRADGALTNSTALAASVARSVFQLCASCNAVRIRHTQRHMSRRYLANVIEFCRCEIDATATVHGDQHRQQIHRCTTSSPLNGARPNGVIFFSAWNVLPDDVRDGAGTRELSERRRKKTETFLVTRVFDGCYQRLFLCALFYIPMTMCLISTLCFVTIRVLLFF